MPINVKLDKEKEFSNTLDFHKDIQYGDVFEYCDSNDYNIGDDKWYGMKVGKEADNGVWVDCIVDLDTFEIYTDIEHYKFLEIIDCSLVKNAD